MKVFQNPQRPCPDILVPQEVLHTFPARSAWHILLAHLLVSAAP